MLKKETNLDCDYFTRPGIILFFFFSCLSDFALVPETHSFQEFCDFYGLQEIELVSFLSDCHSVCFWRGFFIIKKRVSKVTI